MFEELIALWFVLSYQFSYWRGEGPRPWAAASLHRVSAPGAGERDHRAPARGRDAVDSLDLVSARGAELLVLTLEPVAVIAALGGLRWPPLVESDGSCEFPFRCCERVLAPRRRRLPLRLLWQAAPFRRVRSAGPVRVEAVQDAVIPPVAMTSAAM